jgi:hypothetical protein
MSQSQALEWVREALIEPSRKKIIFFTRLTLRLKRDPLPLVSAISKGKQAKAYGAAFEMEHETDDLRSYFTTRVKKCLYHDFFCANGSPEMTRVFCAFDDTWGNVLETGEYGVKFERPTTLGAGDDMCRFQFKRTSR